MLARSVFMLQSRRSAVRCLSSSSSSSSQWDAVLDAALTPEIERGYGQVKRNFDTRRAVAKAMAAEIAPVDWDAFKGRVGDDALIGQLKAEFEAEMAAVADYSPSSEELETSEKGWSQAILSSKVDSRVSEIRVAQLEEKIAKLEGNRVTAETTVDDVRELYADDFAGVDSASQDGDSPAGAVDALRAQVIDELKAEGSNVSLLQWEAPEADALGLSDAQKEARIAALRSELEAWKSN